MKPRIRRLLDDETQAIIDDFLSASFELVNEVHAAASVGAQALDTLSKRSAKYQRIQHLVNDCNELVPLLHSTMKHFAGEAEFHISELLGEINELED